jgi:spoIIIJ-associated protein
MKKWIESTGKTEDAAIQKALSQLGLDRDEVEVEILARAKSGFLGIGSQPAKVKVTYEAPDEEPTSAPTTAPAVEKKEEKKAEKASAERVAPAKAEIPQEEKKPTPTVVSAPAEPGSCEERIVTFLTGLLAQMDSTAQAQVVSSEADSYQVELVGEGLGQLIGRRGETLDAIQQLTNYAVNHGQNHRVRIHLDAENYRAKREESLQRLAHKTAGKAIKNRRNVTLEPMNAYERHVIHAALQDYRGVTTYSIGTEPNRRIVVAYSKEN